MTMKCLMALLCVSFLGACSATPQRFDPDEVLPVAAKDAVTHQPGQATVVVGISVPTFYRFLGVPIHLDAGFIKFDPATGMRSGKVYATTKILCFESSACGGDTIYQIFLLEPGSYALGWVIHKNVYTMAKFERTATHTLNGAIKSVDFSEKALVPPTALRFTVKPDEVAYVGDVVLNFKDDKKIEWGTKETADMARAAVSGTELADKMVVHPMGMALKK
jgi:hypothetical protein